MNTNMLTNIFGFIAGGDLLKNAIVNMIQNGVTADSVSDVAGAMAVMIWAYFTNKGTVGSLSPVAIKTFSGLAILAGGTVLFGCATLFSAKGQIETIIDNATVGTYQVIVTKDGNPYYIETWDCVATDAILPRCTKR